MNEHPPRDGDLPRKELVDLAEETIARYGGKEKARVFFKYTCPHCGQRCTLVDANTLHAKGTCAKCGKEGEITHGGFRLELIIRG